MHIFNQLLDMNSCYSCKTPKVVIQSEGSPPGLLKINSPEVY